LRLALFFFESGKPAFMFAYDLSLIVDWLLGLEVPAFLRLLIFAYKLISTFYHLCLFSSLAFVAPLQKKGLVKWRETPAELAEKITAFLNRQI